MLLLRCPWFDADWYRARYPDIPRDAGKAAAHYLRHGAEEGRDPAPTFSTTGYRLRYPPSAGWSGRSRHTNPVLDHCTLGRFLGRGTLPRFSGHARWRRRNPSVLVCGHLADASIYGAERSLLDLLDALGKLAVNVVVTLPAAGNGAYLEAVQARCAVVHVLPYPWWYADRPPFEATIGLFQQLIRRYRIGLLHANTLVLDEPLRAARACGVPTVIHVRELPEYDQALCEALGAGPDAIRRRVHQQASAIVANSRRVAESLSEEPVVADLPAGPALIHVVPNNVDSGNLLAVAPPPDEPRGGLRVGMISSNLPKKGIRDMGLLADALAGTVPEARCILYGPRTPDLEALMEERRRCGRPDNLMDGGYVTDPAEALGTLDVLVNLSHFQESFGRTVLEAMWAARPVVVYDWGALPELVEHGRTGYVVDFGDIEGVASALAGFAADRPRIRQMGMAAREHVRLTYGASSAAEQLKNVYSGVQFRC